MSTAILDCSDIDQHLGKAITSSRLREPIANNNIRRWAHAMHYPNLEHHDPTFAEQSRWGRIVGSQSFACAMDHGMGTSPACVGGSPNSHLLFGGEEWWFEDRRIAGGDMVYNERIPFDYVIKETKLAGPTCFKQEIIATPISTASYLLSKDRQRSATTRLPEGRTSTRKSLMSQIGATTRSKRWRSESSAGSERSAISAMRNAGGTMLTSVTVCPNGYSAHTRSPASVPSGVPG